MPFVLSGLQNNWILHRNFNVPSTCDSHEGDVSAAQNCENAILKLVEMDVNSTNSKLNPRSECLNIFWVRLSTPI